MGSTEHEDSGMEDILDSIRRIISDDPLENDLPNIADAPSASAALSAPNAAVAPRAPQAPSFMEVQNPDDALSVPPISAKDELAPEPLQVAPRFTPSNSAPINNGNVTSQLANALENTAPQAPQVQQLQQLQQAQQAAPAPQGATTRVDDIMQLTQPVSQPANQPIGHFNGANPPAPGQAPDQAIAAQMPLTPALASSVNDVIAPQPPITAQQPRIEAVTPLVTPANVTPASNGLSNNNGQAGAVPANTMRPPQPMPMRSPVGPETIMPPQVPTEPALAPAALGAAPHEARTHHQPQPRAEPLLGADAAVARMTLGQFNGAPNDGSNVVTENLGNGALHADPGAHPVTSPVEPSIAPTIEPSVATPVEPPAIPPVEQASSIPLPEAFVPPVSEMSSETSQEADPTAADSVPIWSDDADAEPKSTGINALKDALVDVSVAVPLGKPLSIAEENEEGESSASSEPVPATAPIGSIEAEPEMALPEDIGEPSPTELAMKNLLKPMIKTWLDENMPRMVEEVLREEIRLADKSDD